jgi:hypothetical protein
MHTFDTAIGIVCIFGHMLGVVIGDLLLGVAAELGILLVSALIIILAKQARAGPAIIRA